MPGLFAFLDVLEGKHSALYQSKPSFCLSKPGGCLQAAPNTVVMPHVGQYCAFTLIFTTDQAVEHPKLVKMSNDCCCAEGLGRRIFACQNSNEVKPTGACHCNERTETGLFRPGLRNGCPDDCSLQDEGDWQRGGTYFMKHADAVSQYIKQTVPLSETNLVPEQQESFATL